MLEIYYSDDDEEKENVYQRNEDKTNEDNTFENSSSQLNILNVKVDSLNQLQEVNDNGSGQKHPIDWCEESNQANTKYTGTGIPGLYLKPDKKPKHNNLMNNSTKIGKKYQMDKHQDLFEIYFSDDDEEKENEDKTNEEFTTFGNSSSQLNILKADSLKFFKGVYFQDVQL